MIDYAAFRDELSKLAEEPAQKDVLKAITDKYPKLAPKPVAAPAKAPEAPVKDKLKEAEEVRQYTPAEQLSQISQESLRYLRERDSPTAGGHALGGAALGALAGAAVPALARGQFTPMQLGKGALLGGALGAGGGALLGSARRSAHSADTEEATGAFSPEFMQAGLDRVKETGNPVAVGVTIKGKDYNLGRLTPDVVQASKQASAMGAVGNALAKQQGRLRTVGEHLVNHGDKYDLAGLGLLAAPSAITMGQQVKNKLQGGQMDMHQVGHDAAELGGLGLIAAPVAAAALLGKKH